MHLPEHTRQQQCKSTRNRPQDCIHKYHTRSYRSIWKGQWWSDRLRRQCCW